MYNKIFTKILDSSIWLEPTPTRLIWLTFLAAMDEDGFAAFASVGNLAHRARISPEETHEAVTALEAPDENSSDPENEGRRIERVPGGWMILNAPKYRDLVTRTVIKEQTRMRVARHRQSKKAPSNGHETVSNAPVTQGNGEVTPSDTPTYTHSRTRSEAEEGADAQPASTMTADELIESFKEIETYRGIDIDREFLKMKAWLNTPSGKNRRLTKRFMVNWLNKCEPSLAVAQKEKEIWVVQPALDYRAMAKAANEEQLAKERLTWLPEE